MRAEVEIEDEEDNAFNTGSKRQNLKNLGPMEKFVNLIDPEGILFHSIDNDGFKKFAEAVEQYDRGYYPPSQYQLREPLLKEEVKRTKGLLKKQEEEWAQNGCSVMTDGLTNRKRRSIMNFCVKSKEGATFLSLVECSTNCHSGTFIFDYVDKGIEDSRANDRPPMLEKGNYITWESRFRRFQDNKLEDGERMWNSIQNGPYVRPMIPNPDDTAKKILEPLSKITTTNKRQYIADVKVMDCLLQAKPNDIYNSVDACKKAKESKEGESLESVYERLTTLVNIMDRNNVLPILVSINTKFLNCLQPEWSKYVTMTSRKCTKGLLLLVEELVLLAHINAVREDDDAAEEIKKLL
nr:hypothetical protein [Tanacetum cinerariifolium]